MMMKWFGAALVAATLGGVGHAAETPEDPANQTRWGLYLTASEAYDMKQAQGDEVLFVDVREPIEIMFTGWTDVVDVNVPFLQVDPTAWNPDKPVFQMRKNPDFAAGIAAEMEARGMDKDTPVILMCRSGGARGAPSAEALAALDLEAVYVVVDGFEGGSLKDDPRGPMRLKDGWKNSELPWSYKLNKDKIPLRSE
ncbi:MAG: rhodanese-like domain-containing protein [Roseovarius sp.]